VTSPPGSASMIIYSGARKRLPSRAEQNEGLGPAPCCALTIQCAWVGPQLDGQKKSNNPCKDDEVDD